MTIIKSDDFAGLGAGSSVNSRSLNHALGGSGSETWTAAAMAGATGGDRATPSASNGYMSMVYAGNGKARIKFQYTTTTTNIRLWGRSTSSAGAHDSFGAILIGTTSFRIREFNGSDAMVTDTTVTVSAISTGVDYYIELEFNGTTVVAKLFEADGTTQRGSTITVTPGSYPSGGNWGASEYFGTSTNEIFDDFTLDDLSGGGGGLAANPILGGGTAALPLGGYVA